MRQISSSRPKGSVELHLVVDYLLQAEIKSRNLRSRRSECNVIYRYKYLLGCGPSFGRPEPGVSTE
jgi:hypothetical protein